MRSDADASYILPRDLREDPSFTLDSPMWDTFRPSEWDARLKSRSASTMKTGVKEKVHQTVPTRCHG
jgi:hypothetical protein